MKIPWQSLPEATLNRVIEDFVTREGTDYGHADISLEVKIKQVKGQLTADKLYISFDAETESVSIHSSEA